MFFTLFLKKRKGRNFALFLVRSYLGTWFKMSLSSPHSNPYNKTINSTKQGRLVNIATGQGLEVMDFSSCRRGECVNLWGLKLSRVELSESMGLRIPNKSCFFSPKKTSNSREVHLQQENTSQSASLRSMLSFILLMDSVSPLLNLTQLYSL